jgi:hypothetical protein
VHSEQGPRLSNGDMTKINDHFKARLTEDYTIKENQSNFKFGPLDNTFAF